MTPQYMYRVNYTQLTIYKVAVVKTTDHYVFLKRRNGDIRRESKTVRLHPYSGFYSLTKEWRQWFTHWTEARSQLLQFVEGRLDCLMERAEKAREDLNRVFTMEPPEPSEDL